MSAAGFSVFRFKLTGICPPARAAALTVLLRHRPAPVWLVILDEPRTAGQFAEDLAFFHSSAGSARPLEVRFFPELLADSRDMREALTAASDRLAVLQRLREVRGDDSGISNPKSAIIVVVTTPAALLQPVPAVEELRGKEITLTRGQRHSFPALLEQLRTFDYDSEAVCEGPGQYAVRGGIIDVFPITAPHPCRLDFVGDVIDEIRLFDPITQRSGEPLERLTLAASPRLHVTPPTAGLADYLGARTHLALIEPATLEETFDLLASGQATKRPDAPSLEAVVSRCAGLFGISDLDQASVFFDGGADEATWDTESLTHHRRTPDNALVAHERLQFEEEARREFLLKVLAWQRQSYAIVLVVSQDGEERRTREILDADRALKDLRPRFLRGAINEGFRLVFRDPFRPDPGDLASGAGVAGVVFVTETEIFGRKRQRRAALQPRPVAAPSQVDQLLDFSEIVEGDFVVHLQHGIALFRGLTKIETSDGVRAVISLEFDDKVTLHVPLQESHLVSRYVGLARARPKLGRIGTNRWEKTRAAAERATIDLAAQLLEVQARRAAQPGHAFAVDAEWQREFEASFPYTDTRGQTEAIRATKQDMEQARPMDRLICGDVGFGKTEVAIRAAFKAVLDGRQVAVLVPTTVLAQQHLNTFRERMAGYPVVVEMLSRFRSRTEQRRLLAATAAGRIDILIGTHRLLQRDVGFKDLGLVVIDEEQRFGVKHKEVFKQWRAHVDLLSMSATPIPRTLYLALTGARDLSVIETPPADRHPIQTIVRTYDEDLVVEAIRHEVRRGGQVFYLHNRVQTIDRVAHRLRELLPDLAIGVGHGRMKPDGLERVMTEFVAGRHHVLVCTTIIESGLDIPNCNTLLIEGADRFGLAQLYQLRGRVGRFKHQAYAYLLLHRHTHLLDVARQRLNALRQHNQPGAGFRIAMRDLELRGAGNLLGPEQSGHIAGVGFELYCQLLRQSIARLKGDRIAAAIRASVKLDFVFMGEGEPAAGHARAADGYTALREAERAAGACPPIQARIPLDYIGETRLRLDLYRRLALAESPARLRELEDEIRDRFGRFGDEVRALLLVTEIRLRAEQKGVLSVETEGNRLKCLRRSGKRNDLIMPGKRFPRLTGPRPLLRLREIVAFLKNLPELP
ncbi:MAG: transcription-repair coupling factor [Verrucomicrobia bacterium RIFCSPLOWO2_12_FULL_64_8]|nr:MAG: transcription-repair coupling factor [Verrucomicrobia bacterium RIFCSPLOWO2_12_FULL_64_8]